MITYCDGHFLFQAEQRWHLLQRILSRMAVIQHVLAERWIILTGMVSLFLHFAMVLCLALICTLMVFMHFIHLALKSACIKVSCSGSLGVCVCVHI